MVVARADALIAMLYTGNDDWVGEAYLHWYIACPMAEGYGSGKARTILLLPVLVPRWADLLADANHLASLFLRELISLPLFRFLVSYAPPGHCWKQKYQMHPFSAAAIFSPAVQYGALVYAQSATASFVQEKAGKSAAVAAQRAALLAGFGPDDTAPASNSLWLQGSTTCGRQRPCPGARRLSTRGDAAGKTRHLQCGDASCFLYAPVRRQL